MAKNTKNRKAALAKIDLTKEYSLGEGAGVGIARVIGRRPGDVGGAQRKEGAGSGRSVGDQVGIAVGGVGPGKVTMAWPEL